MSAVIAGAACRIARQFEHAVETVVREVVRAALDKAAISLGDIGMVVTVASDTLDGMMVPIRAELAGALGKDYLNVPSSAGHAVSAAAAAIEAGDAEAVLVVGWGAASKLAGADSRANEFDPFYTRPLGATPHVLADLQRQILVTSGTSSEAGIEAFGARMAELVWGDEQAEPSRAAAFCDGAAAIVLRCASPEDSGSVITQHAVASRSHMPLDGSFDPGLWVREALSVSSSRGSGNAIAPGFIEVSGASFHAELRGIAAAIEARLVACDAASANLAGGGAAAWFGPATGLRALAHLFGAGKAQGLLNPASGLFIDMAGPLGQHVTGILIERRSAA